MKLKMINGNIHQVPKNPEKEKYKRFLQLCARSVKKSDIVKGFVFFDGDIEMAVVNEPYLSQFMNFSLFIDVRKKYDEGHITNTCMSLSDHNIINGGYNLYRVFKNKKDAIEYNEIVKSYSYWERGNLCFRITPLKGQKYKVDPSKYKVKYD